MLHFSGGIMSKGSWGWSRRSFLKASLATATLPVIPASVSARAARKHLPSIPTVQDLAPDRLVHTWRDLYHLPTIQNELAYVHATKSVPEPTAVAVAPCACAGV